MGEKRQDTNPELASKVQTDHPSPEDVRIGYQAAVQLAIYDGGLSWQVTGTYLQFAILMIAGAVFPSFVGSRKPLVVAIAGIAVSIAGLLMTSMFASTVSRIRTYEEYWVQCATHLESFFPVPVSTLQGSDRLSRAGVVTVAGSTVKLPRLSAVKSKMMIKALFVCFLVAFFSLLCINILRLDWSFEGSLRHAILTLGTLI
jgi:hypothetical protein